MADKIDQLVFGSSSYDITLPVDDKNAKFYTTASATTNAFTVTIPGIDALVDGMIIHVKFNAATASGATLNVNSLGAKAIYYRTGTAITTHISASNYVTLIYDGTNQHWVMQFAYDSNSTGYLSYSSTSVGDTDTNTQYLLGKRTVSSNGTTYYNSKVYLKGSKLYSNNDVVITSTDLPQVQFSQTSYAGGVTIQGIKVGNDMYNLPTGGGGVTDTWRNIKVNGTEKLGTATSTGAVDFQQGTNVTLSYASGVITIAATDTTYESKSAASGGTAVSLCTTGEKYTWNNKQNALPTTTTANKVLISTTTSGTTKWSDFSSAGFLKTSNTGVLSVDTNTYLTGNQTISLSGDVTGSGSTSITTTLANSGVTAGTYNGFTVNAKGLITAATKRYEHNVRITGYATDSNNVTRYISLTFQVTNARSDAYTYGTITGNTSGSYSLYLLGHTSGTTVCHACGVTTTSTLQGIITGVYGSTTANRLYIRYIPLVTYSSSTAYIKNDTSGETTVSLPLSSSFTFNDTKREV